MPPASTPPLPPTHSPISPPIRRPYPPSFAAPTTHAYTHTSTHTPMHTSTHASPQLPTRSHRVSRSRQGRCMDANPAMIRVAPTTSKGVGMSPRNTASATKLRRRKYENTNIQKYGNMCVSLSYLHVVVSYKYYTTRHRTPKYPHPITLHFTSLRYTQVQGPHRL